MMKYILCIILGLGLAACNTQNDNVSKSNSAAQLSIPSLSVNGSNTHAVAEAYRLAIGDIAGNVQYHKSGVLEKKEPVLYAGLHYRKPWTRDAAINVWNGFGLLSPKVAKNTLWAQVDKADDGQLYIGGQYWDKIIWAIGSWNYYLYSGDQAFLEEAYPIISRSIKKLEVEEFSDEYQLFRGAAVYGDGIAAYPDVYTEAEDPKNSYTYSGIYDWIRNNPTKKVKVGEGLPLTALSTNAVYYQAYKLLDQIKSELNISDDNNWTSDANKLKDSIQKNFWNEENGTFDYLVDPFGGSDRQEALGISFILLFDLANTDQIDSVFDNTFSDVAGIPCVYPVFERYQKNDKNAYGRHSGTVWPHAQGFYADAAKKYKKYDAFEHEFFALTKHATRDNQFLEIYHPKTGESYGGLQEPIGDVWYNADRQTWSATAYLRMILLDVLGMNFSSEGISFSPYLPTDITSVNLLGFEYKGKVLNIQIEGKGDTIKSFKIQNKSIESATLSINDFKDGDTIDIVIEVE